MAVTHTNWTGKPVQVEATVVVTIDPIDATEPESIGAVYAAVGTHLQAAADEIIEAVVNPGGDAQVEQTITHTNVNTTDAVKTVGS